MHCGHLKCILRADPDLRIRPRPARVRIRREDTVETTGRVLPFRRRSGTNTERRRFARIHEPVEAIVRGSDASGERFEFRTILGNLSAGGLYLIIPRSFRAGEHLDFVVRLCVAGRPGARGPVIAAEGVVRRAEQQANGLCSLAAEFLDHRFI
jgi:hypothetical protein